jgi:hypothetical protein
MAPLPPSARLTEGAGGFHFRGNDPALFSYLARCNSWKLGNLIAGMITTEKHPADGGER